MSDNENATGHGPAKDAPDGTPSRDPYAEAVDATGSVGAGNPYGLANALKKLQTMSMRVPFKASPATAHMFIVKPFTGGGLFSLFSTHPPIEKRIARLMENRG